MTEPIRNPPTRTIVALALALAAVTYLESALVEYPPSWLSASGVLAALAALLTGQVLLALMLFRRVRRSEDTYSVFFSRATLLAFAAFVVLTAVMLVPEGVALLQHVLSQAAAGVAAAGARA